MLRFADFFEFSGQGFDSYLALAGFIALVLISTVIIITALAVLLSNSFPEITWSGMSMVLITFFLIFHFGTSIELPSKERNRV